MQFLIYDQEELPHLSQIHLENNEVHIWMIKWNAIRNWIKSSADILPDAEKQIISAYHQEADWYRGAAGKILTRILAAHYLETDLPQLTIIKNLYGKPFISTSAGRKISHNVSHSGQYVTLVFTWRSFVGIDVEEKRDLPEYHEIAAYFHEKECKEICKAESLDLFYKIWTAKEAYVKAIGRGLQIGLSSFEVQDTGIYVDGILSRNWEVLFFTIHRTHRGAVVVEREESCGDE